MSGVAVLLIAIGCADIVSRLTVSRWPPLVTGPVVAVSTAALCGLWHSALLQPRARHTSAVAATGGIAT